MRSLSIGATGMLAQQTNVEVISNNIANMNTTAYARRRAEFNDLLYQNIRRPGAQSSDTGTIVPAGIQLGLGVKTDAVYRITEQGSLSGTDNPLDIAIQGKGYFQVEMPSGETAYTRDGSFQLSSDGTIVTNDGYKVLPGIVVPQDAVDITVNASGEVLVTLDGQTAQSNLGQLQLSTFANEAGLSAIGNNLLLETEASGGPVTAAPGQPGYGSLLQGYLETSNVNVVSEITELISAQRAYEMNSKVIQTADEMMSQVNQLK
jgi:flagellar basal-body rod protein FlgG